jgi:hypothetical protein
MHNHKAILASMLLLACSLAHAQYSWIDTKGIRQFSDRPPPVDTPEAKILKVPRAVAAAAAAAAAAAEAAARPPVHAGPKDGVDPNAIREAYLRRTATSPEAYEKERAARMAADARGQDAP